MENEIIYSAMIPTEPKTKKNGQKIIIHPKTRKPMVIQSEAYNLYESQAGWFIKRPKSGTIDYPVNVRCIFYRKDYHRVDLTNLLEAIDDILVKYKVIKDDCFTILAGHDGSRVMVDREKPRTEIYIEKLRDV